MGVSPRDLLRDARHLAQRKDFEEARRSAISRGFYAAFHGARIFHAGLPFPGRSKAGVGEHENLIHQLRNPDSRLDAGLQKQSIVIGGLLLRLRPLRVTADYQIRVDVTVGDLNDALAFAAQILNLTDPKTALGSGSARDNVPSS
jgi:uncharacterized protein (UPF0332 family)